MNDRLTRLYDNYTGWILAAALLAGILIGGLIAFNPQIAAETAAAGSSGTPTPTAVPPTPVSISVPVETPIPESGGEPADAEPGPAEDFIPAVPLSNGWKWRSPETLTGWPTILAGGTVVLQAESGEIFFLNPDGSPRARMAGGFADDEARIDWSSYFFDDLTVMHITDRRVFAVHPDLGLRWEFPVMVTSEEYWPQYYPGETFWLVVDTANNIYGFTPEEGLLWSHTLDGVPNHEFLTVATGEEGVFYAAEAGGDLYAFDRDGVRWTFDPGENLRSASDPRFGPDGRVYYVVTSGTFGILVAVNPDGSEAWRTRLETFRFYEIPAFSAGGKYVFIDEDFVNVDTGQLTMVAFPFNVDAIYPGEDGFDYLITGHHIIRWQIGPEGFEQLKDLVVNLDNFGGFFSPFLHIHPDGLIEFRLFGERETQLVWLDSNTEAIEIHNVPYSQTLFQTRPGDAEFARCEAEPETGTIRCARNVPGAPEPVWSLELDGIYRPTPGFQLAVVYTDGHLYFMPDPFNFYAFDMEIP